MSKLKGFWSYVHADDEAERGRITQLARDIKSQYEMLATEEIDLFIDRDDIGWGEAWSSAIDVQLESVAFFIPVITPRFFLSPECCRELQKAISSAERFGIKDLVRPILYVEVQDFEDENNDDELVQLIKSLNWDNWTDLRFDDLESGNYRRAVYKLAQYLFDASRRAEIMDLMDDTQIEQKGDIEDNSPGIIDLIANAEEKLSEAPESIEILGYDLEQISQILENATVEIQQVNTSKGYGPRLVILRKTASLLSAPTDDLWSRSNDYAALIHDIDPGIRVLIEESKNLLNENPESNEDMNALFESIRNFNQIFISAIGSFENLIEVMDQIGRYSRDLRPAIRQIKRAMTILIESSQVSQDWVKLIESVESHI